MQMSENHLRPQDEVPLKKRAIQKAVNKQRRRDTVYRRSRVTIPLFVASLGGGLADYKLVAALKGTTERLDAVSEQLNAVSEQLNAVSEQLNDASEQLDDALEQIRMPEQLCTLQTELEHIREHQRRHVVVVTSTRKRFMS
ncbi:hypothetical protein K438DRAFT_1747518 [Mycena galopus ATCC 62051]|nr:hypothetical protein K438DRAFT_1747518 [Mycena galopus ATCC 62051]